MWRRQSREAADARNGSLEPRRLADGGDILQAYWREMQQMRERRRKVTEIQRAARLKNSAARQGTWHTKQTNQAPTNPNGKLPRLRQLKQTTARGNNQMTTREKSNRIFLPEIRGSQARVPASDPRFQELLSSLRGTQAFYGDVQRFAPSAAQRTNNV